MTAASCDCRHFESGPFSRRLKTLKRLLSECTQHNIRISLLADRFCRSELIYVYIFALAMRKNGEFAHDVIAMCSARVRLLIIRRSQSDTPLPRKCCL